MSSFLKKLSYSAETLKDVASGIIKGEDLLASEELAQQRLKVCEGDASDQKCEFLVQFAGSTRCNECGCFSTLKNKLLNAKCPIGKW